MWEILGLQVVSVMNGICWGLDCVDEKVGNLRQFKTRLGDC